MIDDLTICELPRDWWHRLVEDGIEPFASYGLPQDPEHWTFVAAISRGRILAVSSLSDAIHNDWFIGPQNQHSPSLISALWKGTKQVLDEKGITLLHATVKDPAVQVMVQRLGYLPADGKLYLLDTQRCLLNRRG